MIHFSTSVGLRLRSCVAEEAGTKRAQNGEPKEGSNNCQTADDESSINHGRCVESYVVLLSGQLKTWDTFGDVELSSVSSKVQIR